MQRMAIKQSASFDLGATAARRSRIEKSKSEHARDCRRRAMHQKTVRILWLWRRLAGVNAAIFVRLVAIIILIFLAARIVLQRSFDSIAVDNDNDDVSLVDFEPSGGVFEKRVLMPVGGLARRTPQRRRHENLQAQTSN